MILSHRTQAQTFEQVATLLPAPHENYSLNPQIGSSIAIEGDLAIVGAIGDDQTGPNNGAAYILQFDGETWQKMAKLTASDVGYAENFGKAVALWGDVAVVTSDNKAYAFEKPSEGWTDMIETAKLSNPGGTYENFGQSVSIFDETVVVGVPQNLQAYVGAGKCYVYSKPSGGWQDTTPVATLTASNGFTGDHFGWSVTMDDEGILVGAPEKEINGYSQSGAVYVFENQSSWTDQTELSQLVPSESGAKAFGYALALSNGTSIIGAPLKQVNGSPSQGAVYVYTRPDSGWAKASETARLTASDGESGDHFGQAVSLNDGLALIGAPFKEMDSGAAYIFEKPENGWTTSTETEKLWASDGNTKDVFGTAIAIHPQTALVCAPHKTVDTNEKQGSVYVFSPNQTDWTSVSETEQLSSLFTPFVNNLDDQFGISVAIDGTTAVVGMGMMDFPIDLDKGQVLVYEYAEEAWELSAVLTATDGRLGDNFGYSVAISNQTIVVGAPNKEDEKGAAYVFVQPSEGWGNMQETAKLTPQQGSANDHFGHAVAIEEKVIVVGAPDKDGNGSDQGLVYLFEKPSGGWVNMNETGQLAASNAADFDRFGMSVSIDDVTVTVGAPYKNIMSPYDATGGAYVFEKPGTGWGASQNETAFLTPTIQEFGSYRFGNSVAVDGTTVVVGAPGKDSRDGYEINAGAAYVYEKPDMGWENMTETAMLTAAGATEDDVFGTSVAIDHDRILIGALNLNPWYGMGQGSFYLFNKPNSGWASTQGGMVYFASNPAQNDLFGYALAIDQDKIIVGTPQKYAPDWESGIAYCFQAQTASVQYVAATNSNGAYKAGDTLTLQVVFDQSVQIENPESPPSLLLETGETDRYAVYTEGSGTSRLTFEYEVMPGDVNQDLDYQSTDALQVTGNTRVVAGGFDANLVLPAPGTSGSLGSEKDLWVDAQAPVFVKVEDEGDGNYRAGERLTLMASLGEAGLNLESDLSSFDTDFGTSVVWDDLGDGSYSISTSALNQGGNMQEGDVRLTLKATDVAGNQTVDSSFVIALDKTLPVVVLRSAVSSPTVDSPIRFSATFSEEVEGLEMEDFEVSNGTVTQLRGERAKYTLEVTPDKAGVVSVSLMEASVTDWVGNTNQSSNKLDIVYQGMVAGKKDKQLASVTKVYPVPAADWLQVEVPWSNGQDSKLMVYDVHGTVFIRENVADKVISLPVSNLKKGVYVLRVSNDYGTAVKRFVKR
ncbi:Ig-like domain-containing protein [Rapidithrix thailandica]|uniref:Ig-like domain-containing protein n=1 Tax=Rapidithrix thailandica TaxID=413964 RepID=A0AAW9RTP5_9BACT